MSQLNNPSVGMWDSGSQQQGSLYQKFQANLLWVNWYDNMMDAEVLRGSSCTNVEMLIAWAQLPWAGRAVPCTQLPQQLPTKGRELGKGSVAAGEEVKFVLKAVVSPGKNGFHLCFLFLVC